VLHKDAKLELLKRVPLFALCSKRELEEICRLADEIDLPEGKVLVTEGDRGREFFVLVKGRAEVRRHGEVVNTLSDGDFFGEIALVSGRPRTATVTATSPLHALVVTEQAFDTLLRGSPEIQSKVLRALAERVPMDA
jgi:CRP/FNR family cyclic AMP-dependent transcriptional regulator